MIHIDGSRGEGGGQVLRSALALALATGQAFSIERIRAGRRKPGLMRQHLTAVRAAAEVGRAAVRGAELGSGELTFAPRTCRPGDYRFAVGSAGSATLVLETVLPALCVAGGPSSLVLEGGTHNPQSPPYDFLEKAFLPLVCRMGPRIASRLERHGFYPAGGGRFRVRIEPAARLAGLELTERGEIRARRVRALSARLPGHVGRREVARALAALGWPEACGRSEAVTDSAGPGNALLVEVDCERISEVFCGFGRRGLPAEAVADETVAQVRRYLEAGVPVGPHLADQLLVPMALAGSGRLRTGPLSRHATTNLEVIGRFLELRIEQTQPTPGTLELAFGR